MNALITGHSSGIGRELAQILNTTGCRVFGISRNSNKLLQASNQLSVDLSSQEGIETACDWVRDKGITQFIHMAGSNPISSLKNIELSTISSNYMLHYASAVMLFKSIVCDKESHVTLKVLLASSIWSEIAVAKRSAYASAKASLNTLARSIAVEHAHDNVHAVSLKLGFVQTPLTSMTQDDPLLLNTRSRYLVKNTTLPTAMVVAQQIQAISKMDLSLINGSTLSLDGGITIQ